MRTLATPGVVDTLVARFRAISPGQRARWGAMNAHQMAVHIGDATEATLGRRAFSAKARAPNALRKVVLLYLLPRFPRGVRSGAEPASKVVDPAAFVSDIERAIGLLRELAAPG